MNKDCVLKMTNKLEDDIEIPDEKRYQNINIYNYQYVVALAVGGLMEQPEIIYRDFMIITDVGSKEEAVAKYNKITNASYFYGECLACYKYNDEIEIYADGRNLLSTVMNLINVNKK